MLTLRSCSALIKCCHLRSSRSEIAPASLISETSCPLNCRLGILAPLEERRTHTMIYKPGVKDALHKIRLAAHTVTALAGTGVVPASRNLMTITLEEPLCQMRYRPML